MDDVTVDLGEIPIDFAQSLLISVCHTLLTDTIWERSHFSNLTALKAMLSYRIAKAEKTATFVEPR